MCAGISMSDTMIVKKHITGILCVVEENTKNTRYAYSEDLTILRLNSF